MSAASSPVMPGAYRFPRKDLSISTNRPLSTFSTDSAFFSPTEELVSPSHSGFDADDDLKAELRALAQLRRDIRTNLTLRPIPGPAETSSTIAGTDRNRRSLELETPTSATSSIFSYTTAPSSPSVSAYSPSICTPPTLSHSLGRNSLHPTFTASLPDIHNPGLHLDTTYTTPESLALALASSYRPLVLDIRPPAEFELLHIRDSVNLAIPSLILKRCSKPGGGIQTLDALKTFITTGDSRQSWDKITSTTSPTYWNGDIVITDESMDEAAPLTSTSKTNHVCPTSAAWTLLPALIPLTNGRTTYLRGGIAAARVSHGLNPYLAGDTFPHPSPSAGSGPAAPNSYATTDSVLLSYLQSAETSSLSNTDPRHASRSAPLPSHAPSGFVKSRVVPVERDSHGKKAGLFSLKTDSSSRNRENMPIVDDRSSASAVSSSSSHSQSSSQGSSRTSSANSAAGSFGRRAALYDASPSPSPSSSTFPRMSRNRGMTLGIDTKSAERLRALSASQHSFGNPTSPSTQLKLSLPKLHLRTHPPTKSTTLDVPPSSPGAGPNEWPGRLHLPLSPHRPNLIVTSSPTRATRTDDDAPDEPHAVRYLASLSRCAVPGQNHTRPASRSRSPGLCTKRRSPSPYLRSPRTARPKDGPSFSQQQDASDSPPPLSAIIDSSFSESSPASSGSPDAPETFTVSTILPNFLYLGPEMSSPGHVAEVRALGVQRILNMAMECEDEHGYAQSFARYLKIPMRDTVEEENIRNGVREVCQFLDDARLHSQPTYVHCKVGKSRSVTAVMAYLIHANHWPLAKAYAFVLDRRRGISPNIGFVSELMSFEEEELGGKSLGVVPPGSLPQTRSIGADSAHTGDSTTMPNNGSGAPGTGQHCEWFAPGHGHSQSVIVGGKPYGGNLSNARRTHHIRESLPPTFIHQPPALAGLDANGDTPTYSPPEAGDSMAHAQEVEIKDADGRYRHARRAPVDALTLQPMRRVSKAGLESSFPLPADAS